MSTTTILMAASLVFTALLGIPAALAVGSDSCSVNVDTVPTCTFDCSGPGNVTVDASASAGKVTISGSCGGASASCSDEANKAGSCPDVAKNGSAGQGECKISKASLGNDDGTGSCSWSGTATPDCTIDLRPILCIGTGGSGGGPAGGIPSIGSLKDEVPGCASEGFLTTERQVRPELHAPWCAPLTLSSETWGDL